MKYIESIILMFYLSLITTKLLSFFNFENHIAEFPWTYKEIKVMFRRGNKS